MPKPIVLAFSGGLDTSWCVPHLIETLDAEVHTVTVDVGGLETEELAAKCAQLGAKTHHTVDAREAFYRETVRYLIAGNVRRGGVYPLCVGAERTVQARLSAEFAASQGIETVAHGCTAVGNDQVRFDTALRAINPDLEVLAPIRDHMPSRPAQVEDLNRWGLPVPSHGAAYSVNQGLWGVTIGGTETTTSDQALPESAWVWTKDYDRARTSQTIEIGWEDGQPRQLNDLLLSPVELIERLNHLAGSYGIGRGYHLGDTVLGLKGRIGFEAPAATVLIDAHRELEKLVLTGRQQQQKDMVARLYGDWLHEGHHMDPAARDAEALLTQSQTRVTGTTTVELHPGFARVVGMASPFSLMAAARSTYGEAAGDYEPRDAAGFARISGLPSILAARAAKDD